MIMPRRYKFFQMVSLMVVLFLVNVAIEALAYETISNKENRVRVDVRPVQLVAGEPARFEIRMNTHSEELSQDLVAVCTLKDNQGREYQPINWDGSPGGGHHRQGILEFPELDTNTASITLIIREIADVPERIFEWSVKR